MIAPLDIDIIILHQGIHNLMSAVAAVEYIADNVQFINDRVLDELRNGDDESIGTADFDDAVDDIVDIGGAVVILISFGVIEQLIDDVGKIVGHGLAHLGAGVLTGGLAANLHQMQQGGGVPDLV